jgi:ABC-type Mn2+/Zn2+ transport system ATPase subunit
VKINIENCNNIINGELDVCENKLNIFFGCNGAGKSTVANALYLESTNQSLKSLTPYGNEDDNFQPSINGLETASVQIFNDDYVNQYTFQKDSVIKDAFDVLIRSEQYDAAKKAIDKDLEQVRQLITDKKEIKTLRDQIHILTDTIKTTNKHTISKRGGTKGILQGKGAYFNPPEDLNLMQPFFEEDIVSQWAAWRLQGYEKFGNKGICPYCAVNDNEDIKKVNKVFNESFDKSSVETASKIRNSLEELMPYLDEEKTKKLISLFGVKENIKLLEVDLYKLLAEANYLWGKLNKIVLFNGASVENNNVDNLEEMLTDMKVDFTAFTDYFTSAPLKSEIDIINLEIDKLLVKVGFLKVEIAKYNNYIQEQINGKTDDINDFLNLAGFKYKLEVVTDGENKAHAMLKYLLRSGEVGNVQSNGQQLSWGEKHSFALILFMFDVIRKNTKLIILDDPISSFDRNKKYAIINRLFKTGKKGNSLYERTVIMLTHDFEPVIDYIQTSSGRQSKSSICANYFENIDGELKIKTIKKGEDMMSSVVLLKELATDDKIDIAVRIGCLRKFIEHQYKNPRVDSKAYNIISSLMHGRTVPTKDNAGKIMLSKEEISTGMEYICNFISDFNYNKLLKNNSPEELYLRYNVEKSPYFKMLIIRYYIEQKPEARERLKKHNDIFRKYVDETYHIENDYLFSLDVRKFNIVPDFFISDADEFVKKEKALVN